MVAECNCGGIFSHDEDCPRYVRSGIVVKTSDADDDHPVTLEWTNTEHDDQYTVQIWLSPLDGVTVVQVDTPPNVGRVRVMLNDGPLWDGDPETDAVPGAEFRNHPMIRVQDRQHEHDYDGKTETHSLCSVCGQCDGGV